jgi:hypothetical protein
MATAEENICELIEAIAKNLQEGEDKVSRVLTEMTLVVMEVGKDLPEAMELKEVMDRRGWAIIALKVFERICRDVQIQIAKEEVRCDCSFCKAKVEKFQGQEALPVPASNIVH